MVLASLLALPALHAPAAAAQGLAQAPGPVDPQSWVLPADMTWDDYRPIPGFNWADDQRQPPKKLRAALILGDFPDREFLVTRPKGSDAVGNPIDAGGVARGKVGEFYKDLLNTPQAAQPRAHDQRVLARGLLRPGRHRHGRVRPLPDGPARVPVRPGRVRPGAGVPHGRDLRRRLRHRAAGEVRAPTSKRPR